MFYYFYTSKPKEVVPLKKMYVTDYKTKELIEATDAFYVFGSNVVSFSGDDLTHLLAMKMRKNLPMITQLVGFLNLVKLIKN